MTEASVHMRKDDAPGASERVLVIGPAWVGDMVMAQSLFKTLKRRRPGVTIEVAAPPWTLPLLARMPEVSRSLGLPFRHGQGSFAARRALGRTLRGRGYRQAIVLPNSFKSALLPWHAGVPRRTGWRGEMRYGLLNDLRVLDRERLPRMLDRFNALAFARGEIGSHKDFPEPHPRPALVVEPAEATAALGRHGLDPGVPALALCPGAEFGASKRWPPEKYAEAASRAGFRQVWLLGSAADAPVCEAIAARLAPAARLRIANLAGKTSLGEAIDILSRAAAVVSNDSGLMHVAAALERPLVAVYGSTSPDFTPPLSDIRRILKLELPCSPCFQRECPLGHHDCMNKLPAESVVAALDDMGAAR